MHVARRSMHLYFYAAYHFKKDEKQYNKDKFFSYTE